MASLLLLASSCFGANVFEFSSIGMGACRSSAATSEYGDYTCFGGNEGCSNGGAVNCDTDPPSCTIGYLLCSFGVDLEECEQECNDMYDCRGIETTTNSLTNEGKCELHLTTPEYAVEQETYTLSGSTW